MTQRLLLAVSMLALAGCGTATIYKPAMAIDPVGYTSGELEDGRYYVTMSGRADTPKLQVYTFAFRRALEIAEQAGAQGIEVIGSFDQQARTDLSLFLSTRQGLGGLGGREAGGTFGRRGPIFKRPSQLAIEFTLVDDVTTHISQGGLVVQVDTAMTDIESKIASEPKLWES
ncbi:MAG: hypothetical protein AAFX02_10740 [Pseudomonadota bacterium]